MVARSPVFPPISTEVEENGYFGSRRRAVALARALERPGQDRERALRTLAAGGEGLKAGEGR